jgi:hypothetical protein
MFYKAKVALCSEIRTKHINAMWAPRRIFECWTWPYVKLPLGFKRLNAAQGSYERVEADGMRIPARYCRHVSVNMTPPSRFWKWVYFHEDELTKVQ